MNVLSLNQEDLFINLMEKELVKQLLKHMQNNIIQSYQFVLEELLKMYQEV